MKRRDEDVWVRHMGPTRPKPWAVVIRHGGSRYYATQAEADTVCELTKRELRKQAAPREEAPAATSTPKSGTVGAYLVEWLDSIKRRKKSATHESYRLTVQKHLIPAFGRKTFAALDRPTIRRFFEALFDKGLAYETRRRIYSTLHPALARAVLDGKLAVNPASGLRAELRQQHERPRREPHPMTPAEAARFLATAEGTPWFVHWLFLHDTGARGGEAVALKWTALDLDAKIGTISESFSRAEGGDTDTKTHKAREIDLTTRLVVALRQWRQAQREEALKLGRPVPRYVFTTRGYQRHEHSTNADNFKRCLQRSEHPTWTRAQLDAWRRHTMHDLRDTFATTHLLRDYSTLPWVSKQLGHASPQTTERYYYRFLPTATTKSYADLIAKG